MARSRSFVALAGAGVLGLALVGVGASAQFTDSVSASQAITAGTLDVNISSTAENASWSSDGRALTLAPKGPVGSTYTTKAQPVTITNNGDIPATATTVAFSVANSVGAGEMLRDGTTVTFTYGTSFTYTRSLNEVVLNSPYDLATLLPDLPIAARTLAANGGAVQFGIEFGASNLPNGAQGGVITPTLTVVGMG